MKNPMLHNLLVISTALVGVALLCDAVLHWVGYSGFLLAVWSQ